jgi:dihydrofolate synthase/folylpolyglutamate synthase
VLGTSIKKIAREKAAIIKTSTRAVFSAPQQGSALCVIQQRARQFDLKVVRVGSAIRYRMIKARSVGSVFSLQGLHRSWSKLNVGLLGEHQVVNASLAAAVVEYFLHGQKISFVLAVKRGLASARWPARLEIVSRQPMIVVDSAHNVDSVKKLRKAVKEIFADKKVILVFGASSDKDIHGILAQLKGLSQDIILTRADHPRSFDFSNKKLSALRGKTVHVTADAKQAIRLAKTLAGANNIILAMGSVFLAGEIRQLCLSKI